MRFLRDELRMSLAEIADLAGGTETPDGPAVPVRDHT